MAERELRGSWKGKARGVTKSSSPMIGMVYEGQDKFFGKMVLGVLVNIYIDNDEAVVRTKQGVLTSVDINSLKIVV